MSRAEPRRWEIERDRFGVMAHPGLQVGECVKVVEVAPVEAEIKRLRELLADALAIADAAVKTTEVLSPAPFYITEELEELHAALKSLEASA